MLNSTKFYLALFVVFVSIVLVYRVINPMDSTPIQKTATQWQKLNGNDISQPTPCQDSIVIDNMQLIIISDCSIGYGDIVSVVNADNSISFTMDNETIATLHTGDRLTIDLR